MMKMSDSRKVRMDTTRDGWVGTIIFVMLMFTYYIPDLTQAVLPMHVK